jgi:hypothetical protein
MLAHLRAVGALARLAGVAVGRFTELKREMGDGVFGFDEVLLQYFGPLAIPVAYGFPSGTYLTSGPSRWACAPGSMPAPANLNCSSRRCSDGDPHSHAARAATAHSVRSP